MLFEGVSDAKEEALEEENLQMTMNWEEEAILLTTSPMRQAYRTMSPSPRLEILSL